MGSERGVYAYETAQGTRFYFKYRSANGRSATKRGFTSQRAARRAREQMIVAVSRGEVAPPSRETFGEFYVRWLRERRPYLEPGTHNDYRLHGVKRMASLDHIRLPSSTRRRSRAGWHRSSSWSAMRPRRSTTRSRSSRSASTTPSATG